jgi:hypothetical protein
VAEVNYFDYVAKKVAPKPAYQRQPPSRAITQERVLVRNSEPEPKSDGIVVEEFDGSPSTIVRIIGKIRGG